MKKATLIRKSEAKIVDLGTKIIRKYIPDDNSFDLNIMTINCRHPEKPDQFVYETNVHFMIYIISGKGKIICDNTVFDVTAGNAVDVSSKIRFAAEGSNLQYITLDIPAWYPEQAHIVDSLGTLIEQ